MVYAFARLAAIVALALGLAAPAGAARQSDLVHRDELEAQILVLINELRADNGLKAVKANGQLARAAAFHATSMATKGFFSHDSADGSGFADRILRFYKVSDASSWRIGENLVWAAPTLGARRALKLWLNSPPHRRTLLDPRWREIGLGAVWMEQAPGVYEGLDATIVVADFGVRS